MKIVLFYKKILVKTGEQFTYDELNRIKASTFGSLTGSAAASGAYQTSYGYDPNGNLFSLIRKDKDGRTIDELAYEYNWQNPQETDPLKRLWLTNKLRRVRDLNTHPRRNATNQGNITGTDVADQTAADNLAPCWCYHQQGSACIQTYLLTGRFLTLERYYFAKSLSGRGFCFFKYIICCLVN